MAANVRASSITGMRFGKHPHAAAGPVDHFGQVSKQAEAGHVGAGMNVRSAPWVSARNAIQGSHQPG